MKKFGIYILFISSTISITISSCGKKNPLPENVAVWQVFGDTIKFEEHTYNENKQEILTANESGIIGIVDYDMPLDSTYLPLKAKIFKRQLDGKTVLTKHDTLGQGIIAPGGVLQLNANGDRMTTLYASEDSKISVLTHHLKGDMWQTVDTLFLHPEFKFNYINLKLSDDGNTLAVFPAINGYTRAYVNTYRFEDDTWKTLGDSVPVQDILPKNTQSYGSGMYWDYVDFNTNGSKMVIGNPFAEVNGLSSGEVRTYALQNNQWKNASKTVYGKFPYHHFGSSVVLKNNVLSVTAHSRKPDENMTVFYWTNKNWEEQSGYFEPDQFMGEIYSISADARTVLSVEPTQISYGEKPKELYIYHHLEGTWLLLGKIRNGSRHIKEIGLFPESRQLVTFQKDFFKQHIVCYKLID
ncbi:hypothetical protein [Costertonia aggregata]|uniref:Uncharacterized protein n=1 Tax=Costertonia aggregata TaxID=343403 RepID=A0A7H9APZ6_9FLAO|nr:hypothetical protein [Costertonia aggregata]QLG45512.1 hypothetical protein HYG79_09185 [Costertonia aggregata]